MNLLFSFREIVSVTLVLFAVIDILGSIPIVIGLQAKNIKLESGKATVVAGIIMLLFLFLGEQILNLFGIDVHSFAVAGAIIIFLLGLEMVLGVDNFKTDPTSPNTASIVPLAFPLIAGAGTLTTILSLRAEYRLENIIIGVLLNLVFVYLVLHAVPWIQSKIGKGGTSILRRIFGILLLAIAIKLFKSNTGLM